MQCDKFLYKLPFSILKYLPVREKPDGKCRKSARVEKNARE